MKKTSVISQDQRSGLQSSAKAATMTRLFTVIYEYLRCTVQSDDHVPPEDRRAELKDLFNDDTLRKETTKALSTYMSNLYQVQRMRMDQRTRPELKKTFAVLLAEQFCHLES